MDRNKNILIISLKFAPGLKKEFIAIGNNFKKHGYDVRYIISGKYSNIENDVDGIEYFQTKDNVIGLAFDTFNIRIIKLIIENIKLIRPSLILFYNPHPLNPEISALLRIIFPEIILSLYLHDPYKPDKSIYGFKKSIYMKLVEIIQKWTVKFMDYVISPSEYSSKLFKEEYTFFKGKNFIAPLLVPDQKNMDDFKREFFTIVGSAHLATGHDDFIRLVNYVAQRNLDYKFFIISSSDLKMFLSKLTQKSRNIIEIVNKPIITDNEINEVIKKSLAVFRLDKEVTQSGVVPVSYMNSTPVIARDIPGLRQHVWDKETGVLVPSDFSCDHLIKAMEFVKDNFIILSKNSRERYEQIWADWNFSNYYKELITGIL